MRDIIRQKIVDSLALEPVELTPRDVRVPAIPGKAKAVIGPRRAGKTTFLWQVLQERLENGVARQDLVYFSFEDERLAGLTSEALHIIPDEYFLLHPECSESGSVTFFLDEIQVVRGWEQFVRRLMDSEKMDIFLSGSSAHLLSREVATSMRGRALEALVYPFSFREFLRHNGNEPQQPFNRLPRTARTAVRHALRTYLVAGGYPEAQGAEPRDHLELLKSYVDTALLRDIGYDEPGS